MSKATKKNLALIIAAINAGRAPVLPFAHHHNHARPTGTLTLSPPR